MEPLAGEKCVALPCLIPTVEGVSRYPRQLRTTEKYVYAIEFQVVIRFVRQI